MFLKESTCLIQIIKTLGQDVTRYSSNFIVDFKQVLTTGPEIF